MSARFKVESGLQLLARLTKKQTLNNFYPRVFGLGPNSGEVIELIGDPGTGKSFLLCELICQTILPEELGGAEASVIIFNSDGNISFQVMCQLLLKKLQCNIEASNPNKSEINNVFKKSLQRVYIVDTFSPSQFYITIQNLETFLTDQSQISMVVFDTLTAYYWSEQTAKMVKMSSYIKNTLKLIQRIAKQFKVTIIYTKQQYFDSSGDIHDLEDISCRIHLQTNNCEESLYEATIINKKSKTKLNYKIVNSELVWV